MPSSTVKRYIEPALPPGFPHKKTRAAARKMPPSPPRGVLVALKTRAEIRSGLQTINCYILPIPSKTANEVLLALREIIPGNELQHLRRLSKPAYLPPNVAANLPPPGFPPEQSLLYILICQTDKASIQQIVEIVAKTSPFQRKHGRPITPKPVVSVITVPANLPTSPEQCTDWSKKYWPTVYKRGNPFGPHPALVENTVVKLTRADEYMALARKVAQEVGEAGVGYACGGVVVDPETGDVIAAAGDGRLRKSDMGWCNPLSHAVQRLVEMVAQKRLKRGEVVSPNNPITALTDTERVYLNTESMETLDGQRRNGVENAAEVGGTRDNSSYLCHNMHVYLTHEPCVMCAMALLHSRIGLVVFQHRMIHTGALVAKIDEGLGLGLFWRPDMNWKYLAWQWMAVEKMTNEIPEHISA
ncbi:cytidine deaminase-like protein [Tricharina praecox]|uniref:cytidine deaminase-like protein n=1 Tax=Tricharina praecox TaxID=43433 RepID=UPI002220C622|nr:cytidine deaminase-like protein [Tricharina praecox]KAI5854185.1 cytidine deaminase-like protein [Tricharina praecox]